MSKFAQLLIIGLVGCAASMVSRADECKFSAERNARIEAAGAKRIEINARAGDLNVEGVKNAAEVVANGRACASSQEDLDQTQIDTRREGDVIYVNVRVPDTDQATFLGFSKYAWLDLRLTLPANLPVTALDSSGEAEIRGVASLDMTDSSGELRIRDVAGDVSVRDSSGELWIRNIGGSVRLSDSSGAVDIDQVGRDLEVEVDSSGEMEIQRVTGNVHIRQDSSGDIRIADVDGAVRIDSDSSGGVDVRRVGSFKLGSKGSGGVNFADVKGAVEVPQR
jgi:hypothetical protein